MQTPHLIATVGNVEITTTFAFKPQTFTLRVKLESSPIFIITHKGGFCIEGFWGRNAYFLGMKWGRNEVIELFCSYYCVLGGGLGIRTIGGVTLSCFRDKRLKPDSANPPMIIIVVPLFFRRQIHQHQ